MKDITPEVRAELLDHLVKACITWTEEVMEGYFDDPNCAAAQEMVLEAYAEAIVTIANRIPHRRAALQTFVFELQDRINKESSK